MNDHLKKTFDADSESYDMEAHLQRALPYLCELADAISDAGFLGVRSYRYWSIDTGPGCSFRIDSDFLAGRIFKSIFHEVEAGGSIPPTLSVLIQLEAANSVFEKWRAEDESISKEAT